MVVDSSSLLTLSSDASHADVFSSRSLRISSSRHSRSSTQSSRKISFDASSVSLGVFLSTGNARLQDESVDRLRRSTGDLLVRSARHRLVTSTDRSETLSSSSQCFDRRLVSYSNWDGKSSSLVSDEGEKGFESPRAEGQWWNLSRSNDYFQWLFAIQSPSFSRLFLVFLGLSAFETVAGIDRWTRFVRMSRIR